MNAKRANEERAAVKRVLRLVDSFLVMQWNPDTLLANRRGTLMARSELTNLLKQAAALSILKPVKRNQP